MAQLEENWFEVTDADLARGPETLTNRVSVCGKLVKIRSNCEEQRQPPVGSRKPITGFSAKARYNALKTIATIDWPKLPHGWFVTLTYPDCRVKCDYRTATKQRSNFIRYVEKYCGCNTPILWRKELKDRQSGEFKGHFVAHWHLSIFTETQIPVTKMTQWWRNSIRYRGVLRCHRKKMNDGEHAALYLAKYLAKRVPDSILVDPPNLSKVGRAWGLTRRAQVPWCEEVEVENLPQDQMSEVMTQARILYNDPQGEAKDSFTFLGIVAERMAERIFAILS